MAACDVNQSEAQTICHAHGQSTVSSVGCSCFTLEYGASEHSLQGKNWPGALTEFISKANEADVKVAGGAPEIL